MDRIRLNPIIISFFVLCFILSVSCPAIAQSQLRLDSVSHTLGIVGQDLMADLTGTGFNSDTRVSMALDVGNTKATLGSLNWGGSFDIALSGTRAYIVGIQGLLIADVSNPANPIALGSVGLPDVGQGVDLSGTIAYVAARENAGLQIIDVSNPVAPTIIASVETPDFWAHNVTVSGDTVYLPGSGSGGFIIDVSDPAAPEIINSEALNYSYSVAVSGTTAYVGKTNSLEIMDVSNPALPSLIGTITTGVPGYDVMVADNKAYIAGILGLVIADVDPYSPDYLTTIGSVDTPGRAESVVVADGIAYVADSSGGLQIIDISDPTAPAIIGAVATSYLAEGVAVSGTKAYVADYIGGLEIIDVSDPSVSPVLGQLDSSGTGYGVYLEDDIAYLAAGLLGIQVIDVSDPAEPTLIGALGDIGSTSSIFAAGNTVYVVSADGWEDGGFWIIDATDPTEPVSKGWLDPGDGFRYSGLAVSGNIAYVGKVELVSPTSSILEVVDVSDPMEPDIIGSLQLPPIGVDAIAVSGSTVYITGYHPSELGPPDEMNFLAVNVSYPERPFLIGKTDTGSRGQGLTIQGNVAYVADMWNGIKLVDIADPTEPLCINEGVDVLGSPRKAVIEGNIAYVVNMYSDTGQDEFVIVDLADPSNPVIIGTVNLPGGHGLDIVISGSLAYIANYNAGLVIVPVPTEISPITVESDTSISLTLPSPDSIGNYSIRVFNTAESSELPGAVTFTDNPDLLTTRAIIVAGTNAALDPVWPETKAYADQAYENLRYQGYAPEDILYLSANAAGECPAAAGSTAEGVDCKSTLANLEYAVKNWAMTDPDSKDLLLYMVDHGGKETFHVNDTETLTAQDLDTWLDYLQSNMPDADPSEDFKVVIVYDACESGTLIKRMSPPGSKTRITMASASTNQPAYFLDPTHSFSHHFWSTLSGKSGDLAKPSEAYKMGAQRMSGYQTAALDANGNSFPNEQEDLDTLASIESTIYALRRGYTRKDMGKPVIDIVSEDQILDGVFSADLMARDINDFDDDTITRVWAEILPPDASPDPAQIQSNIDTVELKNFYDNGVYEGTYEGFTVGGTYLITYFAIDEKGICSLPRRSLVTQLSGTPPPPDIYEDDDSSLESQVVASNDPEPQLHTFHESDDRDWLKFYAVAGKTYKIRTANLSPLCDTKIDLYDTDGTTSPPIPEHSNPANYIYLDNGAGEGDHLVWTCLHDGIYYVKLTNIIPHYGANVRYELQVYEPTADFFTQGQVEGRVRREGDNAIITSGTIKTTGASAIVQSNGMYIMFLEPAGYTLRSDIQGYVNESKNITVTTGSVLTNIDFFLAVDNCPYDPNKTEPGICGCGVPDIDTDNDGIMDCVDDCPYDPDKTEPGMCGCGVPDIDTDDDGIMDCVDDCPYDPDKTEPGICGCGIPDTDTDSDGIADCIDDDDDDDGMFDEWEVENFGDLSHDGNDDGDSDGLTDLQEYQAGTNPVLKDTDSDLMPDGWEVQYDLNPLDDDASGDKDGDGYSNFEEYRKGTDPTDPNSYPSRALPWLPLLLE